MLKLFRYIALVEGITTIALFLIAMPLKYGFGNPVLVPPVGLTHGLAFLAYVAAMLVALPGKRFGFMGWLRTLLAAFVPFGTFLNDGFVKRHEARHAALARS